MAEIATVDCAARNRFCLILIVACTDYRTVPILVLSHI